LARLQFAGQAVVLYSFTKWTFTGTNTGPSAHPATGKPVKVSGVSFARYEGGKLIEELVYFDALEFLSQLGLIEPPKLAAAGQANSKGILDRRAGPRIPIGARPALLIMNRESRIMTTNRKPRLGVSSMN